MPHLIIEFAESLADDAQVATMLAAVHRAVVGSGLFEESHIRVRAIALAHYLVGGARRPFVHVQCRIHAGRTPAQRRQLSETVLAALRAQGWPEAVLTVEVVEMERASYAKGANPVTP